jgi:hypothetical protein
MVQHGSVHIPSNIVDTQDTSKGAQRRLHSAVDSTSVVETTLVPQSDAVDGELSNSTTSESGPSTNAGDKGQVSRRPVSTVNCLDIVKQRFQKAGFSEEVAHLASRGRRESTNKVYSARLGHYYKWCGSHKVDQNSAPLSRVADFLKSRFDLDLQTTTVRGYLSAVESVHLESNQLKSDPVINFLLEGMNIARPAARKVWPSWGLPTVLKKLNQAPFEPIQSASLRGTALKTLFFDSGCVRTQMFGITRVINRNRMVFSKAGVTLYFRPRFFG